MRSNSLVAFFGGRWCGLRIAASAAICARLSERPCARASKAGTGSSSSSLDKLRPPPPLVAPLLLLLLLLPPLLLMLLPLLLLPVARRCSAVIARP